MPPNGAGGAPSTPEIVLCCLLKAVAIFMHFPGRATTAALTYLRHFFRHRGLLPKTSQISDDILAAACIFLASKVEEVPLSNNHLLNISQMLHQLLVVRHVPYNELLAGQQPGSNQTNPSTAATPTSDQPPLPPQPPAALQAMMKNCSVLVGNEYYASKAQLLDAEQHVLRLLKWQLLVPQPLTALLHIAAVLNAPAPLVTAAIALLHDAITFTDALLPVEQQGGAGQDARGGHVAVTRDSHEGHMGSAGVRDREVVVAVACVLLASELLGGSHCITGTAAGGGGGDSQSNHSADRLQAGLGSSNVDGGSDAAALENGEVLTSDASERVAVWVRLFTRDVSAVLQTADHILTAVTTAHQELAAWAQSAAGIDVDRLQAPG